VLPPALAFVDLSGGIDEALARLPAAPGVGQLLGPDGRNLVLGPTSNLRRWLASHLGLRHKPAPGKRPKTNLAGIATAVGFVETRGPFHQRLTYERLMAPLVPLSARRDLRPPAFLQLDQAERFPRVSVVAWSDGLLGTIAFGPFRERRAAEKARDSLQKLFPLRPCDYRFEPHPTLPLGLGCLYAQVRSCAAPCLARVSEEEYRALASRAAAWLADPRARTDAPAAVPPTVAAATSTRALVVDAARARVGLFPVLGGRVCDSAARWTTLDEIEGALQALDWNELRASVSTGPGSTPDDWPWLTAWLRSPRARASYVVLGQDEDGAALAARVVAALPARAGEARVGGKVGATRGRD
jgi:hypothetical protein